MTKTSGLAITSFVLGIISFILGFIPVIGVAFGITSIIFGIIALTTISKNNELTGKWMAITGIILSALAILLSLLMFIGMLAYFGVLNPETMLPEKTTFGPTLVNTNKAIITQDGTLVLSLKNTLGSKLSITNIEDAGQFYECENKGKSLLLEKVDEQTKSYPVEFKEQEIKLLTLKCGNIDSMDDRVRFDLKIDYINEETGIPGQEIGSIMTRIN